MGKIRREKSTPLGKAEKENKYASYRNQGKKKKKRTEYKRDLTTVLGPAKGATSVLALPQAMNRSNIHRRSFPHAKTGEVFGGKAAV